ncbi:putative ATP-dependent kinase TDA10 [Vanrija pseudolonga]|uniref:ATP-dependent kinase TDA10 n=1 Tax=Vanrija pseudolonga TaxID=143232 RepID=A0AAF0YAH0_9TREE|nr:putative ATP-dependent kinase TDA10 [Vanrija pseudolonga]
MASSAIRFKAELLSTFVSKQVAAAGLGVKAGKRPLLVSMQGPQGSGKSTLAAEMVKVLADEHGLKCAVASMDDFYLTYAGLKAVASANPNNSLLSGRGPPGTHDLPLLSSTLARLRDGPAPSQTNPLHIPTFDKSQNEGYGERSTVTEDITAPIDVFVLEGWSLGFAPVDADTLRERWADGRVASRHPIESLQTLDTNLAETERSTGDKFDCHIAIRPISYDFVYDWRLQAEHNMKAKNGGKGMTDDVVRAFVDRYMPVYEVFGEGLPERQALVLTFDKNREVVDPSVDEGA